jgi:hypothetical protein
VANLSERTVALIDKIHHKLTPGERTSLNDVDDEFEKFEVCFLEIKHAVDIWIEFADVGHCVFYCNSDIFTQLVIDHVDLALERVDSSIDELRGKKNEKLPPGSQSSSSAASTKPYVCFD